ncbi:uncharacterized protein [Littorina saxatilis]|uniref:Uncharacterized protein n=1 Tax=Littorina saxatilis TaxID=31220 RepID=A0AAN9GAX4_9CAEN
MANGRGMLFVLGTLLCLVVETAEGSTCSSTRGSGWSAYTYSQTCAWGCCGYGDHQYCCTVNVGLVIGIVLPVIIIGVIITVVCCCIKKQHHSGRAVQPTTGTNIVAVVGTGAYGQPAYNPYPPMPPQSHQPMGGMAHQPYQPMGGMPPQNKPADAPPAYYTYSDPAYPPGGNANFPQNPPDPFVAAATCSS